MKSKKIWWILFKMDPLGFIWAKVRDTTTYREWVEFLCRCYGHKEPLLDRFSGSYCNRCGSLIHDRRGIRLNVIRKYPKGDYDH